MPTTPTGLTGDGKKAWERLAPAMYAAGILTAIDGDGLESYCRLYGEARECWRQVKKTGGPVVFTNGQAMPNPYLTQAHKAEAMLHKLRNELGLNTGSRSRIEAKPPTTDEDPEAFLKFPGTATG
ncbi:MAG: phage terminase small subunit P27 family [Planctomycetota bacterium]